MACADVDVQAAGGRLAAEALGDRQHGSQARSAGQADDRPVWRRLGVGLAVGPFDHEAVADGEAPEQPRRGRAAGFGADQQVKRHRRARVSGTAHGVAAAGAVRELQQHELAGEVRQRLRDLDDEPRGTGGQMVTRDNASGQPPRGRLGLRAGDERRADRARSPRNRLAHQDAISLAAISLGQAAGRLPATGHHAVKELSPACAAAAAGTLVRQVQSGPQAGEQDRLFRSAVDGAADRLEQDRRCAPGGSQIHSALTPILLSFRSCFHSDPAVRPAGSRSAAHAARVSALIWAAGRPPLTVSNAPAASIIAVPSGANSSR